MTVTKLYCDHCRKELDTMKDWCETSVDIGSEWFETDLCEECGEELARLVRQFCNRE